MESKRCDLLCVKLSQTYRAANVSSDYALLTLGAHAQRRVTIVDSVCLSVKSHLTSGASVHPETLSRTQRAT